MKNVEYSQRPERIEVVELPRKHVLDFLRENITETVEDGETRYTADEYRLTLVRRGGMEAEIAAQFAEYLARAKTAEYEELASEIRAKRAKLLSETDYLFTEDYPMYDEEKEPWRVYRQALRDIPEQPGFPYEVVFPAKPGR